MNDVLNVRNINHAFRWINANATKNDVGCSPENKSSEGFCSFFFFTFYFALLFLCLSIIFLKFFDIQYIARVFKNVLAHSRAPIT